MTYRASTIKRERRTRDRVELLDAQIIDVLREDHPQSVRHVFYRMTDPRLQEPVEKSDRGYRHVQDRCVKLRRSGAIPYGWIADMSRRGYYVNTFDGAGDFLRRMLRERIENLLPEGALAAAKVAEQSEREHIERMARMLGA